MQRQVDWEVYETDYWKLQHSGIDIKLVHLGLQDKGGPIFHSGRPATTTGCIGFGEGFARFARQGQIQFLRPTRA